MISFYSILIMYQNGDSRIRSLGLIHHLSLPKTFPQITTIEKFLHFQDSVPCKIRAKRGCATHPRSIAERVCLLNRIFFYFLFPFDPFLQNNYPISVFFQVRRTRISERMRKLQELFPNMDKVKVCKFDLPSWIYIFMETVIKSQ